MANVTIKNIPDELYEQLKQRAALHRRSINSEVIVCLEHALHGAKIDSQALLTKVRALRKKTSRYVLTDKLLLRAKSEERQ